jgi:hypothetical protein
LSLLMTLILKGAPSIAAVKFGVTLGRLRAQRWLGTRTTTVPAILSCHA